MVKLTLKWSRPLPYTKSNVKVHAPESAGVYRLSYTLHDKVFVFYVGQAENLYEGLRDHLSRGEPNNCIRSYLRNYNCYFRFAGVASQLDRNGAERALYDHFDHVCNEAAPVGLADDINFE